MAQNKLLRADLLNRLLSFLHQEEVAIAPEHPIFLARALNRIQATRYFPAIVDGILQQLEEAPQSTSRKDVQAKLHHERLKFQIAKQGRKNINYRVVTRKTEEAFVAHTLYLEIAKHNSLQIVMNRVMQAFTAPYLEFIRLYRRLVSLEPTGIQKAKKLQQEVLETPFYANRDWLLEKLNEILLP